ncbi:MAG: cache domain-containing protein [Microcoleus sp. PH2017_02_FOX_O_A]|nr:cache domain-containing protein [Microcoleus sp. PH2017_02_FOX_O_A]
MSLRIKAIVFAIALGTIPVILTGAITFFLANQSITSYVINYQETRALATANEVSNFMLERYQDIKQLARLSILNDPRVSQTTSTIQKEAMLDKYIEEDEGYDSIAVADLKGNTILQSRGEKIVDLGKRDYFQEVTKTNQAVIMQPIKSTDGKYAIFTAAPVVDVNTNETIAVIRTRTPITYLEQTFKETQNKLTRSSEGLKKEEFHLIDGNGKFFAATETEQISRDAASDFSVFAKIGLERDYC